MVSYDLSFVLNVCLVLFGVLSGGPPPEIEYEPDEYCIGGTVTLEGLAATEYNGTVAQIDGPEVDGRVRVITWASNWHDCKSLNIKKKNLSSVDNPKDHYPILRRELESQGGFQISMRPQGDFSVYF